MDQSTSLRFARLLAPPAIHIFAAATAASTVCAVLRTKMVYYEMTTFSDVLWIIKTGLENSYFDLAVIWGTAIVCLLVLLFARRWRGIRSAITLLFCGFTILSVLLACVNILAVNLIGGSLTFQWIYYADLAHRLTARSALLRV